MHIVYVCREYPPSLRMGGIASYLKEVSVAMVQRGHEVTVIAANDDTRTECEETVDDVRVIRLKGGDFIIPSIEKSNNPLKKLRGIYRFSDYRYRIKETIKQLGHVDVIEIAEYGAEGYYLHNLGIPVTMRLHTPTLLDRETGGIKRIKLSLLHEYWVGSKELQMMTRYENVTSCSNSLLNWCQHYIPQFTDKGRVIYNPLDMSKWRSTSELNYNEDSVFYAGTVAETKGVGDLIDAIALLNNSGRHISLTIAGKLGKYGEKLRTLCSARKYDWCKFLGHITRDELKEYYSRSKVSCFPSWWENMPMVVLESMAIGNIVIGSSNGGMAEIITDGVDGYLVEPQNSNAIANAISNALELSPESVRKIRANANQRIRKMFSTELIAAQLEEHYESIRK